MIEDGLPKPLQPGEYVCPNPGCWLIHLQAAGDAACDSRPA